MAEKTTKAKEVIKNCTELGDNLKKKFEQTDDIKVAENAIKAYAIATRTGLAQTKYKHLTGNPSKIDFFED